MDYTSASKADLLVRCAELQITKCKSKTKQELIKLIHGAESVSALESGNIILMPAPAPTPTIQSATTKLKMIDLFAGTGAFTSAFESTGNVECVFANELDL